MNHEKKYSLNVYSVADINNATTFLMIEQRGEIVSDVIRLNHVQQTELLHFLIAQLATTQQPHDRGYPFSAQWLHEQEELYAHLGMYDIAERIRQISEINNLVRQHCAKHKVKFTQKLTAEFVSKLH